MYDQKGKALSTQYSECISLGRLIQKPARLYLTIMQSPFGSTQEAEHTKGWGEGSHN